MNNQFLFQNDHTKEYFQTAIQTGKLSHAFLLEGQRGAGKKTLARFVCLLLACISENKPCGECNPCRSVLNGSCPDVRLLKREEDKKTIGVEQVRDFLSSASLTPGVLDFKAYIIDEADLLTVQSQNALLKIIEEPPENTYFFLLCEKEENLLPTLCSRVQRFALESFSFKTVLAFLKENGYADTDADILSFAARSCNGSIGKAIELLTEKTLDREAARIAHSVFQAQCYKNETCHYFDFLTLCLSELNNRDILLKVCDTLERAYSDVIAYTLKNNDTPSFLAADKMQSYSVRVPVSAAVSCTDKLMETKIALGQNANLTLCVTTLASYLWNII